MYCCALHYRYGYFLVATFVVAISLLSIQLFFTTLFVNWLIFSNLPRRVYLMEVSDVALAPFTLASRFAFVLSLLIHREAILTQVLNV